MYKHTLTALPSKCTNTLTVLQSKCTNTLTVMGEAAAKSTG